MPAAKRRITTVVPLPPDAREILGAIGQVSGPENWEADLAEAEGLVTLVTTRVDASLLDRAPALRIVANAGVGYENVDLSACAERGITVTNTPGVLTDATADLAIALLLITVRRLTRAEESLRAGEFRGWGFWDYLGGDISGATIGVLGMGRIGQAFARRARAFGAHLRYTSRTRVPREREEELSLEWVDWETLLETSDILSLHVSFSELLRHLLDANALRRMKRGSYVINTARGALIDEAALVDALDSGHLAGAGLDVYEREPVIHPGLLVCPTAVLLPHVGSATIATRTAMAVLAARNVAAVLSGQAPLTPVIVPT